jgi:hypothetical protein
MQKIKKKMNEVSPGFFSIFKTKRNIVVIQSEIEKEKKECFISVMISETEESIIKMIESDGVAIHEFGGTGYGTLCGLRKTLRYMLHHSYHQFLKQKGIKEIICIPAELRRASAYRILEKYGFKARVRDSEFEYVLKL